MSISLFEHNQKAYDSATAMLRETGKAAIIHPTGTGKSFIGFKLCEDNPDKTVCWISPSEYIFRTQVENLKRSGADVPHNIKFYTYSKLNFMTDEDMQEIGADYLIFDEFHRKGAPTYSVSAERLIQTYPGAPMLGLSATSVRYLDNQRDMADELFDGNIASSITLGDAIVTGVLKAPLYITSVFSYQKELERYEKKIKLPRYKAVRDTAERYLEELRRTIENSDGLDVVFEKYMPDKHGKYIVFCANKEHLDSMRAYSKEWFARVDKKPHVYTVYSDSAESDKQFADFKSDNSEHLKLLFCIDMLNEGVHVDDIDGVILFRPTVSPTVYKQQIGRALTAGKNKTPVIFDVINNFENLYSMGAIEQEMACAVRYYNSLGEGDKIEVERFEVIGVIKECAEIFEKINEALSATWEEFYRSAEKFYNTYHHLNVEKRYKDGNLSLGQWIDTQRRVRNGSVSGNLTQERIDLLDKLNMRWESYSAMSWEKYYSAAVKYAEKYGSFTPQVSYVDENKIKLGAWAANLRTHRKNGSRSAYLTEQRINLLDKLGFVWDVLDYTFEKNYAALLEFYKQNGHLDVPVGCVVQNVDIGAYVRSLRHAFHNKNSTYRLPTEEQQRRLNEIGMLWEDKFSRNWNKGFEYAVKYREKYGSLDVPTSFVWSEGKDSFPLGKWIAGNRSGGLKSNDERKAKLDSIGMIWQKPDPWEYRFSLLKKYYDKTGTTDVPLDYRPEGVWLNKWVNEQRQIYIGNRKGKSLTDEQISKLKSIGFSFESSSEKYWQKTYSYLKEYFDKYGNTDVPVGYMAGGIDLNNWCVRIRGYYFKNKLTGEQIRQLQDVNFRFNVDKWDEHFSELKKYVEIYHTADVDPSFRCADGTKLKAWAQNCKNKYNKGKLSKEREEQLRSVGVVLENMDEHAWNENYRSAEEFYKLHGHLDVIVSKNNDKDTNALAYWLYLQRKNKSDLSVEKTRKLSEIGMIWDSPYERRWENGFNHLVEYKNRYGNVTPMVTYKSEDSFLLGRWVLVQQQKFADGKLSKAQIERLCSIGVELTGEAV